MKIHGVVTLTNDPQGGLNEVDVMVSDADATVAHIPFTDDSGNAAVAIFALVGQGANQDASGGIVVAGNTYFMPVTANNCQGLQQINSQFKKNNLPTSSEGAAFSANNQDSFLFDFVQPNAAQ